jgi:hypothetical protein
LPRIEEPTPISESLAKCARVAYNVSKYMGDTANVYQNNKTGAYYFRLESDNRPIPDSDLLIELKDRQKGGIA